MKIDCDYLIIGAGVIGLAIAMELKRQYPAKLIIVIEKERDVAYHSSGRNSGVLHAGFYYTSDSLKAKFTKDGNKLLKEYCNEKNIEINSSEKIVIAKDEDELNTLYELEKRGLSNGVNVRVINEKELKAIDSNINTYKKALYSPDTATIDPVEVCMSFKEDLIEAGVKFYFEEEYLHRVDTNSIESDKNIFHATKIVNCAGLYADKIAKDFNFSKNYVIIPFKGIYLKYNGNDKPIKVNVYPVPNLDNPFLGVHYTITKDGTIKIGPTAIPAFWRENYSGLSRFKLKELIQVVRFELKLFVTNSFDFRKLAYDEVKKYNKNHLVSLAESMVKKIDKDKFNEWSRPGIRAQLLNTNTLELLQDFVVEGDGNSVHVLNAVSPAFTSSIPFANWVVENYINKRDFYD